MEIYLPLTPNVMPKNSSALPKRRCLLLFFVASLFLAGVNLVAQEPSAEDDASSSDAAPSIPALRWYRSNGAGMAIEMVPSRLAALRNEYALSVEIVAPNLLPRTLPAILSPYYDGSFRVELRRLYENGEEIRRQWIFRDARRTNRIIASGSGPLFGDENPRVINQAGADEEELEDEEPRSSGFIEIRNSEGALIRELQFNEDFSEWDFRYTYRDGILLRTETWFKESPFAAVPEAEPSEEDLMEENLTEENLEENLTDTNLTNENLTSVQAVTETRELVFVRMYTDIYRYTRSGSIRAIDRTLHEGMAARSRVAFPALAPRISSPHEELPIHGGAYTAEYFSGEQLGERLVEGNTISYTLDNRGRVLGEIWRDEDGIVIGELRNVWAGDRLRSVTWKADDEEHLVEFEYDRGGNRIVERNFRDGVLERTVTEQDGMEVEELFMNGRPVLRAFWQNGIKISEERIR